MSAVRKIRQNNPDATTAWIRLRNEPSDAELAQALAQNEHIESIVLEFEGVDAAASWGNLLRVLATRDILRRIVLVDEEVYEDMAGRSPHTALTGRFLQATQQNRNVINVVLHELFLSGETLAHFLDSATHLTSFTLGRYYMENGSRNTEDVLVAALKRKTNLQTLDLHCDFGQGVFVPDSLTAHLLQPSSPLKELTLDTGFFHVPPWTPDKLRHLLRAVEASTLDYLFLGGLGRTNLGILQRSIPAFKLKHLVLRFSEGWHVQPADKQALLLAFKGNFTLRSVESYNSTADGNYFLFDRDQNQLLQFYLSRNEQLAEWIENPASIPRHLWPEALKLAMEAGEGSLFGSLRTMLGSDYGSSISSKRKRKRPQHYTPS